MLQRIFQFIYILIKYGTTKKQALPIVTVPKENLIEKSGKAIKTLRQINLRKKQSDSHKLHFAECFIAHYVKLKLLKCISKKKAEVCKLQSVSSAIYQVIIEQKSGRH